MIRKFEVNDRRGKLLRLFAFRASIPDPGVQIARAGLIACVMLLAVASPSAAAQGMASGNRTAARAKALPEGAKVPELYYVDVAAEAGLTGVNVSGAEANPTYIVETTGTGVAILDYDLDGLQDILLINADRFGEQSGKAHHYLYRNLGGLRFEAVADAAGLKHTGWGQGVCAGDVDDDGRLDLLITHWGQNVLYRNAGGRFTDETKQRGLAQPSRRWSTGCAFLDYDRDGDLDLFVAHYIDFDPAKTPKAGENSQCRYRGLPVLCGPMGLPGETMSLYENDGGRFRDVSEQAGVAVEKQFYGFTPLTGDFDNDGFTDVYVACDSTASLLFRNLGGGKFEEVGLLSGTAYNEHGVEQAGMGAIAADIDGNGLLDIFKTNFSNDTNTLYRNEGDWLFADATVRFGLAVETRHVGWGAAFLDFDHDGRKDIFVVNGHVYPGIDQTPANENFKQPRLAYWNGPDRHFYDLSAHAGAALEARHSSRGLAIGDLDNDGDLEIVIVNLGEPPSLLQNKMRPPGESLLVQALTPSGRDAIGARITVQSGELTQFDEVRSGGYHISQGDFRPHFGLGDQPKAVITVRWPTGEIEEAGEVEAGQWVVVQQGKGVVKTSRFAVRTEP